MAPIWDLTPGKKCLVLGVGFNKSLYPALGVCKQMSDEHTERIITFLTELLSKFPKFRLHLLGSIARPNLDMRPGWHTYSPNQSFFRAERVMGTAQDGSWAPPLVSPTVLSLSGISTCLSSSRN
jgi:hypothetical protein